MKNYSYSFTTERSPKDVFELLLNIEKWWSGIYQEKITGNAIEIGDEFSFSAGGGMHSSTQKLVELIPNKKIVWQVTESKLSYLHNPVEWENTYIIFEVSEKEKETEVTFTHRGLLPDIECYQECSTAWTQYLQALAEKLRNR